MRRNQLGPLLLAYVVLASSRASAQAPADRSPDEAAARLFDEGLVRFQRQDFAGAAQAFLAADALVPNAEARKDAISTALRAQDPVLIARAADRALRSRELDEQEAQTARAALTDALQKVASIDVQCTPQPCSIQLDGTAVDSSTVYALPGTHVLLSEGANGTKASAQLHCIAGQSYRVALELAAAAAPPSELQPSAAATSPATEPPQPSAPATSSSTTHTARKPLPPFVFIAASVGTVALAGLTTWSGLEALSARAQHESEPDAYDPEKVRVWQRRTDYLLLGAVVLGLATGAAGLWWVDWGSGESSQISVVPNDLGLSARGRF